MQQQMKAAADGLSLANVAATIMGWLPEVAAVLSIIWTSIQIWNWWKKRTPKE